MASITEDQFIVLYKEMCYEELAIKGISFINESAKRSPKMMNILGEVIKEEYPQYLEYFNKILILA